MSVRDASKYLSLSEAIDTVKAELLKAEANARSFDNVLFQFKECEIELALEFEPKAGAEFNLGVFKVSAGAGVKGGHKVTVRFAPTRDLRTIVSNRLGSDLELGDVRLNPRNDDPV